MAERQSPLAGLRHGAPEGALLTVSRHLPGAILQITMWPRSRRSVESVIGGVVGVRVPPVGRAATGGDVAVIAASPGRLLVLCDSAPTAAKLHRAIPPGEAALTDLSHGRTILRLAGFGSPEVLAKGAAIDFDLNAFPAGRVAATAIHHMDVLVHRREADVFDVWVLRGFAEALTEWLLDAGLDFGIGLQSA